MTAVPEPLLSLVQFIYASLESVTYHGTHSAIIPRQHPPLHPLLLERTLDTKRIVMPDSDETC